MIGHCLGRMETCFGPDPTCWDPISKHISNPDFGYTVFYNNKTQRVLYPMMVSFIVLLFCMIRPLKKTGAAMLGFETGQLTIEQGILSQYI